MSSALAAFNPQQVGEAADIPSAVPEHEAREALASLSPEEREAYGLALEDEAPNPKKAARQNLKSFQAKSKLGRFLASGGLGQLVLANLRRREEMEQVNEVLKKFLTDDGRSDEIRLCSAKALLESISGHCKLADVELRLLEAASHSNQGKARQNAAPAVDAQVAYIQQNFQTEAPKA